MCDMLLLCADAAFPRESEVRKFDEGLAGTVVFPCRTLVVVTPP